MNTPEMVVEGTRMRSPLIVATLLFGLCVGMGWFVDEAFRSAVEWLALGSGAAASARPGVRSRPHGVRISNLTANQWSSAAWSVF